MAMFLILCDMGIYGRYGNMADSRIGRPVNGNSHNACPIPESASMLFIATALAPVSVIYLSGFTDSLGSNAEWFCSECFEIHSACFEL